MKRTTIAVTALLVLSGCGSQDAGPGQPEPAASESEETAVEAAPPPAPVAELGGELPTDFGTIRVKKFRPTVDVGEQQLMAELGMERWGAALVRTCVADDYAGEPIKLGWAPWSLADRQGGQHLLLDLQGQRTVDPSYPFNGERTTRPGTCVEGWVMFDITEDAEVTEVVYESPSVEQPLVWEL